MGVPADLSERLVTYVNTEISLVDDPVETDTDLLMTGAVDSLGVVSITHWLETELGTEVDPTDVVIENFQTVDRIVAYCERTMV